MDTELQLVAGADGPRSIDRFARELQADPAWQRLDASLRQRGFRHWAYAASPTCHQVGQGAPLRVTTYPMAHVEACKAGQLYRDCPGLAFAREQAGATDFSVVRANTPVTGRLQRLLELNRRFDVRRGVVISLRGPLGMHAGMALAFEGSPREWAERGRSLGEEVEPLLHDFNRALLARHARAFATPLLPPLGAQQRELIRLLAEGHGTEAAAGTLHLSVHTVNKHIAALKRITRTRSAAQLTACALQWGLI
jgi:DNA-binding CsgD family transcriptional regulator